MHLGPSPHVRVIDWGWQVGPHWPQFPSAPVLPKNVLYLDLSGQASLQVVTQGRDSLSPKGRRGALLSLQITDSQVTCNRVSCLRSHSLPGGV
jgi:hypothetical protein